MNNGYKKYAKFTKLGIDVSKIIEEEKIKQDKIKEIGDCYTCTCYNRKSNRCTMGGCK